MKNLTRVWHSEYDILEEAEDKELLETLASIEHDQWVEWAQSLAENETLSSARVKRWEKLYVPYDELTEESKEQDRVYARKVLKAIKDSK